MNFEDMIQTIENIDPDALSTPVEEEKQAIIKALKAAKVMRDAATQAIQLARQSGWYDTANRLEEGAKSWDGAFKEGK